MFHDTPRFHLSQNNGSVCLHSEYSNWTEAEKHFMTKSVSALHPILPVYFNILSPGLGPYSNFEIVIIIFELENIG